MAINPLHSENILWYSGKSFKVIQVGEEKKKDPIFDTMGSKAELCPGALRWMTYGNAVSHIPEY